MKFFLQIIIFLVSANISFAQDSFPSANRSEPSTLNVNNSGIIAKKALYFEGSVLLQSVNFEAKFYRSKSSKFQLNGRVGFGYFHIDYFGVTRSIGGVLGLNFITGRKNNHFDASIGGFIGSVNGVFAWPIGAIGYRYQKPSGRLLFKTHVGTLGIDIGLGFCF